MLETENYWKHKINELAKLKKDSNNEDVKRWEKEVLEPWNKKTNNNEEFSTTSDIDVKTSYSKSDLQTNKDKSMPGEFPFTRGPYPNMYRGKKWTMRMFSGFGTPEDTNNRLKYLIKNGQTGLSIAFDMPTLYGYDADNDRSKGEVGKCGCNISSLKDMEILLKDIPLNQVSTSMTINAPASILKAMYASVASKNNIPLNELRGTVQTDILKEYIAQKEWAYPPKDHMRIVRDMMEYCTKEMPKWNYVSISGYHIREAGATAIQEVAFTLSNAIEYVQAAVNIGMDVDAFAPRLSFFFNCHNDFFEEIAKFRAARSLWYELMQEKFSPNNPKSSMLRLGRWQLPG